MGSDHKMKQRKKQKYKKQKIKKIINTKKKNNNTTLFQNPIDKIAETEAKLIHSNTHIHDPSLFWLGTGT